MKALALQYQHKTSNKENVSASLVYISKTRQTWCGVLLPALTARSISILFAAKISSFLSVSRSARWQMISLLWQVNKIIQFFSLSDKAPKELFTFLNVYKRYCPSPLSKNMCHLVWMQRCKGSSRTARHFCLFLHRWAWRRVRTELNIRACRCSFTAIKKNLFSSGKLTGRFKFREEGSYFLAFHNVSDDMACYFGVGAICNNHWGATVQGPKGSFDLQPSRDFKKKFV